jgi:hypothetical protein
MLGNAVHFLHDPLTSSMELVAPEQLAACNLAIFADKDPRVPMFSNLA